MNRLLPVSLISFSLLILTGCLHKNKHNNKNQFSNTNAPTTIVANNNTNDDTGLDTGNDKKDDDVNSNISDDDKLDEDTGTDNSEDDKTDENIDTDNSDDGKTDENVDTENPDPGNPSNELVSCEVTPEPIKKFIRVQVTYGLLNEGAFISGESGGLLPITITAPVSEGAIIIPVDSTTSLVSEQLLTYVGSDGEYRVGQIESTTSNTITLKEPLVSSLTADSNSLWNFYDDAVHPNNIGFKALADYSYRTAASQLEPNTVHALLGDSWFKRFGETAFADRLLERLPSGSVIKNEGIGGNTLCDLLARVDDVIDTHNPNYVWINSSINDFFAEVTQSEYKARMQALIGIIQAAGATAIVMDPAPGLLNNSTSDGRTFRTLAQRYATQILDLLAEAGD